MRAVGMIEGRRPVFRGARLWAIGAVASGALALLVLVVGPAAAAPRASALPALRELAVKARSQGRVRVIARLEIPDSALAVGPGGASSLSRRAAIRASAARLAGRLGRTDWRTVREFDTVPFVALELSPEALDALEASGEAGDVVEDRLERAMLPDSVPIVRAGEAWDLGYDGTGWTIAVLDTGVDAGHPFLAGKVVAEACFSANASCPNGTTTQYGPGSAAPCDYAPSECKHGTHVAGIAAGRGDEFSGVARGATIVAVQVFSMFTGKDNCADAHADPCAKSYTSDTIAALEYVYAQRASFRIAAANMSLGGGRYFSQAGCDLENGGRKEIVESLRAAGIATVAAAGNQSYDDSLSSPGCMSSVVSVGATNKSDQVASFSNSASFLTLLAPGTPIFSAVPPDDFAYISGTSQATPHVAGAFAILDQRMGEASVDTVLSALLSTGVPIYDPRNALTKPRIDVRAALDALPSPGAASGLQITPDGKRTLISKDVGGQRWAITSHDGTATVTGNVFDPAGGEPEFVFCERTGSDGNPDPYAEQISFSCSSASDCTSLSCPTDEWTFAAGVTLPGSFFLPPTSAASGVASTPPATAAGDSASSALQITPDEMRTLISKDVSGERWAITRNADDLTVTGNVYSPEGGDPQFVWCEYLGSNGDPDPTTVLLSYACSVASRCPGPTCSPEQWRFYANVTLPGSFFLPR